MSDALVVLDQVQFAYPGDRQVLTDCSLRLHPGDRVGLTGANGSGKSTLLKLIVGLVRPKAGQVAVLGRVRCCERDFHDVRGPVGLLFQDSDDQLFCPTVAEDVAFGPLNLGKSRAEARSIVAQTLAALGLADYQDRITYQLSGGEKRLVALASVLAMQPQVLLLDEPVTGLDNAASERVAEILARLPQAMLIVSHDWSQLGPIVTKRLTLAAGRLEGEPS